MRTLVAVAVWLLLSPAAGFAQEDGVNSPAASAVTVQLETPKDWSGETIQLPPGFARDLTLKGVEVIRFAPGMFEPQSESFFSYSLIFWLPRTKPLTQKQLHDELLKYYRGLASAVARGRKLGVEPDDFKLNLVSVEKLPNVYRASLDWAEPFRTGQAQTLHFTISSRESDEYNGLLLSVAASPQPYEHAIWKQLDGILKSAKFVPAEAAKPDAN
ncbi:hypothetical protein GC176_16680 [bacterium]|nr:hypothetical protein [bacterium]